MTHSKTSGKPAARPNTDERVTLTIKETAKKLGVGRNAAYKAARDGTLPTIRIGGRILVSRAGLDRLLAGI